MIPNIKTVELFIEYLQTLPPKTKMFAMTDVSTSGDIRPNYRDEELTIDMVNYDAQAGTLLIGD